MLSLVVALVLVGVQLFYYCYWRGRKLPPGESQTFSNLPTSPPIVGPIPLPIFGNSLSFLFNDLDVQLQKWHRKYGDVHTIWNGNRPAICVCDPKLIFETFIKDGDNFADRPYMDWNRYQRGGDYGVFFVGGNIWRENRRFMLRVLRDFGLSGSLMQERILHELDVLITNIKGDLKAGNGAAKIQDEIELAVGDIINVLLMGYTFGREQREKFFKVKQFAKSIVRNSLSILFRVMETDVDYYRRFPFFRGEFERVVHEAIEMREFFDGEIKRHKKEVDLDASQEPTDFVEAFLRHRHKLEQNGEFDHPFSMNQLYGMIFDVWIAALETTSTTLNWLCVYLIDWPEIQQKLHKELDAVIDGDRPITVDDRNKLHYVNAVIAETQRYSNLVPFNVLHQTSRDVWIGGYHIPAGTAITNQVSCVLMDPRYFPEPEQFKPERFLDAEGKFFQPPELMPFSVGKRSCLGESLARLELFLFTANIFNHFKFRRTPTYRSPKRVMGATIAPEPFECLLESRF